MLIVNDTQQGIIMLGAPFLIVILSAVIPGVVALGYAECR
jgi:hypothetical protein